MQAVALGWLRFIPYDDSEKWALVVPFRRKLRRGCTPSSQLRGTVAFPIGVCRGSVRSRLLPQVLATWDCCSSLVPVT